MNNKEEFRNVKGYEGIYQVSNQGRIKSLKFGREKVLAGSLNCDGYKQFTLSSKSDGKYNVWGAHQLVAVAFLSHSIDGHKLVINHINFDKTDNRVENLEIVTNRKNCNLKHIKSSSKYTGVSWLKCANKWRADIYINGKLKYLGLFTNELEASNAYQSALKTISI